MRFQLLRRPSLVPLLARLAAGPDGVLLPELLPFQALADEELQGHPRCQGQRVGSIAAARER
eukprot:12903021-Heterocapsa_arctica.AAC.1